MSPHLSSKTSPKPCQRTQAFASMCLADRTQQPQITAFAQGSSFQTLSLSIADVSRITHRMISRCRCMNDVILPNYFAYTVRCLLRRNGVNCARDSNSLRIPYTWKIKIAILTDLVRLALGLRTVLYNHLAVLEALSLTRVYLTVCIMLVFFPVAILSSFTIPPIRILVLTFLESIRRNSASRS